jgi:hypothetical protein
MAAAIQNYDGPRRCVHHRREPVPEVERSDVRLRGFSASLGKSRRASNTTRGLPDSIFTAWLYDGAALGLNATAAGARAGTEFFAGAR